MATEAQLEAEPSKSQFNFQAKEVEISSSIKGLQEESLQIIELVEMERTYSVEVVMLVKQIIEPLNTSFHVKPGAISKSDSTIRDVVLTPQGVVCIIHDSGTINSRNLESLPSEIMVRILSEVIPEVKQVLTEKRQKISARVGMLEKIAREFRKVSGTSKQGGRQQVPQQHTASKEKNSLDQQDAMKEAVEAKN